MASLATINLPWPAEAVLRLALAAALGALIGIEREYHGRSAGFRTQLLVGLGSALAMVVSLEFARTSYVGWPAGGAIRVDPARVAYGVMTGMGFIGGGAILRDRTGIRGLTTAAGLWCTTAVGLACGVGMYLVAGVATVLVVFALFVLSKLDRLIPSETNRIVRVTLPAGEADNVSRVEALLIQRGARIERTEYDHTPRQERETIICHVRMRAGVRASDLRRLRDDLPELIHIAVR